MAGSTDHQIIQDIKETTYNENKSRKKTAVRIEELAEAKQRGNTGAIAGCLIRIAERVIKDDTCTLLD